MESALHRGLEFWGTKGAGSPHTQELVFKATLAFWDKEEEDGRDCPQQRGRMSFLTWPCYVKSILLAQSSTCKTKALSANCKSSL